MEQSRVNLYCVGSFNNEPTRVLTDLDMLKYRHAPPSVVRDRTVYRARPILDAMTHRRSIDAVQREHAIHPRLGKLRPRLAELLGLDDPTEIDAVLDDLRTLLFRCLLHLRLAKVHRKDIRGRAVRGKRARATAAAPKKGRRPSAANFAARQLGLGLAFIWWDQTRRRPARLYDGALGIERGDYRAFVQLVVDALPERIVRTRTERLMEVDYMVRTSTKDFDDARQAPEEYRRRGLVEERPWLRGSSDQDAEYRPMSY